MLHPQKILTLHKTAIISQIANTLQQNKEDAILFLAFWRGKTKNWKGHEAD